MTANLANNQHIRERFGMKRIIFSILIITSIFFLYICIRYLRSTFKIKADLFCNVLAKSYLCNRNQNGRIYEHRIDETTNSRLLQDTARVEGMALWLVCPGWGDTGKRCGHTVRAWYVWPFQPLHVGRNVYGPERPVGTRNRLGARRFPVAFRAGNSRTRQNLDLWENK